MRRLILLPLLFACAEPSDDVDLSFATFEVRSAYFAPIWNRLQEAPSVSYTMEARAWEGSCGDRGAGALEVVYAGVSGGAGAIAEGVECPVGRKDGACGAGLEVHAGGAVYKGVSGSVKVVSVGENRLELELDVDVSTSGRSCTGDPREFEVECTCTSGDAVTPGGECPAGTTERLQMRIDGELCQERCACDVPGADACGCPAP